MLTLERAMVAERKFRAMGSFPTVEGAKAVLTETPNNIWTPSFMTLQSAIAEYRGHSVVFHASAGYDPHRGWNTYRFTT
jgi:hypothetical protein